MFARALLHRTAMCGTVRRLASKISSPKVPSAATSILVPDEEAPAYLQMLRSTQVDVNFDFRSWAKHNSPFRHLRQWLPHNILTSVTRATWHRAHLSHSTECVHALALPGMRCCQVRRPPPRALPGRGLRGADSDRRLLLQRCGGRASDENTGRRRRRSVHPPFARGARHGDRRAWNPAHAARCGFHWAGQVDINELKAGIEAGVVEARHVLGTDFFTTADMAALHDTHAFTLTAFVLGLILSFRTNACSARSPAAPVLAP